MQLSSKILIIGSVFTVGILGYWYFKNNKEKIFLALGKPIKVID